MKNKNLADLLAFKANLFEVIIIAVLVSLGVNIFSSGVIGYLGFTFGQSFIIGALLIVLGTLVLLLNLQPINSGTYSFEGVVCFDKETYDPLPIDGYDLADELNRILEALFSENKALHKIWTDETIGSNMHSKSIPKSHSLLIEALEYYVLNSLSLHLSAHFHGNKSVSDDYLVTLERESIPDVLLENRFLDLFSKPMEEREQFLDFDISDSHGKIVYAMGNNGAIFDHFEMVLPKGSTVIREKDSSISINTNRFKLNFLPVFNGYSTVLPQNFENLYMGRKFDSVMRFKVDLIISIDFSTKFLLTKKGWEYYWWLDSYLDRMESSFSKKAFLSKISWYQNAAVMHMAENRRRINAISKKKTKKG